MAISICMTLWPLKSVYLPCLLSLLLVTGSNIVSFSQSPAPDPEALARQYVQNKEYEKAIPLYKSLYEQAPFDKTIYLAYLDVLLNSEKYEDAESLALYMSKIRREDPSIILEIGKIYDAGGKKRKAEEQYEKVLDMVNGDEYITSQVADAFSRNSKYDYAIKTYEKARGIIQNPYAYATELAVLYGTTGNTEAAIQSLLDVLAIQPSAMEDVREALLKLTENDPKKAASVQKQVTERIKKQPDNPFWAELLTWAYMQKGDYEGALKQITDIDKKLKEDGSRVLNFAASALKDNQYDIALKAYDYVLAKGEQSGMRERATAEKLMAQLGRLKAVRPVDPVKVDQAIAGFMDLFAAFPQQKNTPLIREYALVKARYAHETDTAIALLQEAINTPNTPKELIGYCKLDLGDYYILNSRIWDASLTYSQVDKAFRQDMLGEEARFRNAKLAYYRGDFDWAQGQLSVLKASTTELIANDALYLSVLITENTPPDSNMVPLLRFAAADLLLFQNKTQESDLLLDSISKAFPETPLQDDILLLRAKIAAEEGRNADAIAFLEKIVNDYGQDVLGDDAAYRLGNLYQYQLRDKTKALLYYERLITAYPGSTFVQAARIEYNKLNTVKDNIP